MKFDSDVHWIPAVLPEVVAGDEAIRLRNMARQRLRGLDEARPVVRELLLAGLSPDALRFFVAESSASTDDAKKQATGRSVVGFFQSLVGRRATLAESRDQRSKKSYALAAADLDQWESATRERSQ